MATTETDEILKRLPPLPDTLTIDFARQWVAAAGEDPEPIGDDWCWDELAAQYPPLLDLWWEYLERATTGNPAMAAYYTTQYLGTNGWRTFQIIERATTGDPALAAYLAARDLGMDRERAIEIIERATIGDPARAAYLAARYIGMPLERAFQVIERATTGDPAEVAYTAVLRLGLDPKRALAVIERAYKAGSINEWKRDRLLIDVLMVSNRRFYQVDVLTAG
jgi:hypothetical protein